MLATTTHNPGQAQINLNCSYSHPMLEKHMVRKEIITGVAGRIIAISDIHANIHALRHLIDSLALTENDHLVFLGDYIDRGGASREVLDYLIQIKENYPSTFLMGNHEEVLIAALKYPTELEHYFLAQGGDKTLKSYGVSTIDDLKKIVPQSHIDFLNELKDFALHQNTAFVHAGWADHIERSKELNSSDIEPLRYNFAQSALPNQNWTIICGHSTQKTTYPLRRNNLICIDTACGHNKQSWLSAYDIKNEVFTQANADLQIRRFGLADSGNTHKSTPPSP